MLTIIGKISKLKLFIYILFSLLYSFQGLLMSFLIQAAGKLDVEDTRMILIFGAGGVLLFVFIYACMYINNVMIRAIIEDFNILVSKKSIEKFYQKRLKYTPSELNSFLTQDVQMFWQEYLAPLLVYPVFFLSISASVAYLLLQNVQMGLLFTIGGCLMIIPQFVFNKKLQKKGEELSTSRIKSMESITDFTQGIDVIRSNQASKPFSAYVLGTIRNTENKQYSYFTTHNLVMFWTGPLKGIGLVLPLMIGLLLIRTTSLTLTTLLAMMTAAMNLISPLQQLLDGTARLQSAKFIKDKIISILNVINDGDDKVAMGDNPSPGKEKLKISAKNLRKSFADKILFENLSFNIPFGKKILLSGASGSGKSTLFGILSGEDSDFSGSLHLEDENGNCYEPSYTNVSVIHQSPYVFKGTLRDNLALFQNFSDNELLDVLRKVKLADAVADNLDFQLDGQNLSGGQSMKLELARCLLRLKPILLVDEVTAALDETNAREIRGLIYAQNCTIIEISHKDVNSNFDEIIKLEDYKAPMLKEV